MGTRNVTIEDEEVLQRLDTGITISKDTVYKVRIRENGTEKAGRKTREWTFGELAWIASFQVEEKVCFRQVKNLLEPIPADDPDIVAGRRIWPE